MEKVDILLATYNTNHKYLKQQIDSILKQTYTNIHLIISDDNSTDTEVKQILEQYSKKDKRIELYLQTQNLGYIKNFEFLLNKSNADYICFSDHDDIWYPEKVEKSLKKLQEQNVDLVYCNCKQIDENGKILHEDYFKYKNMPLVKGKNQVLGISRYLGIGCSQMFTKDVKEKMLPFTNKVMAHDWLASFIANENKGVNYIEEPMFEYRLHTSNVFGGRTLAQNIHRWKEEHGKSYSSYLQYRKDVVIGPAYLDGVEMCLDYATSQESKEIINTLIKYYKELENAKYINFNLKTYFKYLNAQNMGKKRIKELMIFHMPILGYIRYVM